MTLIIVFIGAICDYYLGAVGAVLGALVVVASLSKSKVEDLLPSLFLIALSWGVGALLADSTGALIGVVTATTLALWLETGRKFFNSGARRPHISSRDSTGS